MLLKKGDIVEILNLPQIKASDDSIKVGMRFPIRYDQEGENSEIVLNRGPDERHRADWITVLGRHQVMLWKPISSSNSTDEDIIRQLNSRISELEKDNQFKSRLNENLVKRCADLKKVCIALTDEVVHRDLDEDGVDIEHRLERAIRYAALWKTAAKHYRRKK